jgi:hypothetical protein
VPILLLLGRLRIGICRERAAFCRRRWQAEMWAMLDDVLHRAQWRAERDGAPAHALGPYGEHYARKHAEYVARDHPAPGKAARRYMAKMFIRDLWCAWSAAV